MKLLGKKASFIPAWEKDTRGVGLSEDNATVTGRIHYVNQEHGWFSVTYRAGDTIQRECFKFCDIYESVTVHG